MTKSQQAIVDQLRADYLTMKHRYGDASKYEVKAFEVDERPDSQLVFVLVESGLKGDENTMASIFCRDRLHLCIRPRGALSVLNARDRRYKPGNGRTKSRSMHVRSLYDAVTTWTC